MAGFSFGGRDNCVLPTIAPEVLARVRDYFDITGSDDEVLSVILEGINNGTGDRHLIKWCKERDAYIDRTWCEILAGTIQLAAYSEKRRAELERSTYPLYWQIDCMTAYCKAHNELDECVFKADDPVWKSIYPPNGWLCGCGVVGLDPEIDGDIEPTVARPSDALLRKCSAWLKSDPIRLYREMNP